MEQLQSMNVTFSLIINPISQRMPSLLSIKRFLLLAALSCLYGRALEAQQVWSFVESSNYIFAGTDSGVVRSSDNGSSWQAVNQGLPHEDIFALAESGNSIVAGTNSHGVYLFTNNGESWTAVNNGLDNLYVPSISTICTHGTSVFAAILTGEGIYRTTDTGASWFAVNNGLPAEYNIHSIVSTGAAVFAGGAEGVFRSTNNGESWSQILDPGLTDSTTAALIVSGNKLYACTSNGLFVSSDEGSKWHLIEINLQRSTLDRSIGTCAEQGGSLYVGTTFDGVFLSPNDGKSCSPINDGWTDGLFRNAGLDAIAVQTLLLRGETIFAGTSKGIFRRINGESWEKVYPSQN